MRYDLSILIPARNEMFISNTVADILKNKRGKTQIIVGLDGQWANPSIPDHPDVTIVYISESIGQRAMTNRLCKISRAKWVAKVDAHCSFAEGFDVELLNTPGLQDDWTIVPTMKNLHAFDWKCPKCGSRWYQSPTPTKCMRNVGSAGRGTEPNPDCDNKEGFYRKLVWKPRDKSPNGTSYRFDETLHFQYFGEFKRRPEGQGDVTPTMSLQGSFFMMTREKYWELNICDEAHGSWGQQGTEVACKTWLSGGQVMVNQKTWYAHMFRTQGGDFTFPYPQSQRQIDHSRQYSKDLFVNGKFKGIHDLQWLINKFAPVPGWEAKAESKGIIYYTDNQLNTKLAKRVQNQIKSIGLPIVSASLKPMDNMGTNFHVKLERGVLTMFKQILVALENSTSEYVFFCEHDVLYHPSHFNFTPPTKDKFYYNQNVWRVRALDGKAVTWKANQVAEICVDREYAIEFYKNRIKQIESEGFNGSYEPEGRENNNWISAFPNIDIRHDKNLSKSKWSPEDFRDKSTGQGWQETTIDQIPGWSDLHKLIE